MKYLLITTFVLSALAAFSQDQYSGLQRNGFIFGFSVGSGVISRVDCNSEVALSTSQTGLSLPNLKFGWMLNERLAILGMLPGIIYEAEGLDRSFNAFVPSVQYWIRDRWWLNGGLGLAMDLPAFYEVEDISAENWHFGYAAAFSTGYELLQKEKFALDFQTQLHFGSVFMGEDQQRSAAVLSIGLGFNWY